MLLAENENIPVCEPVYTACIPGIGCDSCSEDDARSLFKMEVVHGVISFPLETAISARSSSSRWRGADLAVTITQ